MSGVILWIIIVVLFIVTGNKNKKKQPAKPGTAGRSAAASKAPQPVRKVTAARTAPVREAAPQPEGVPEGPAEEHAELHVEPHLHTLQPLVHVSEHDHDNGSMEGFVSTEGTDPCHAGTELPELHEVPAPEAPKTVPEQEASSLTFSWQGDDLVRAFVMSEILTRPCDRKR